MRRSSPSVSRIDSNQTLPAPSAEKMLEKLRSFCGNHFFELDRTKRKEQKDKLRHFLKPRIEAFCDKVNTDVFNPEPNLIQIRSPCFVFGDLHGNVLDLFQYEQRIWSVNRPNYKYVFLGDFVDRGKYSVEVVLYLFALKLLRPQQFFLIRGNHEVKSCNITYTFEKECQKKFGITKGNIIFNKLNDSFSRLPLALVIDGTVFCCHGGIPRSMPSLEQIRLIPKPLVNPSTQNRTAHELMWNDPIESMTTYSAKRGDRLNRRNIEFIFNRVRKTGYYFTHRAVKRFLKKNKLQYIIRAHECEEKGYKFCANHRLITVFSSSSYDGEDNITACVQVTKTTIRIVILKDPKRDKYSYSEKTRITNH